MDGPVSSGVVAGGAGVTAQTECVATCSEVELSGQLHAPAAVTQRQEPPLPIELDSGCAQTRCRRGN